MPVLNDGLVETTEMFRVTLSNPTNATLRSPAVASVRIYYNDTGLHFEFSRRPLCLATGPAASHSRY